MTFEEWWSGQHGDPYEIGFMQACKIAFEAGSKFEQQKAELAMDGANEAFGHIVDEKKDLQKECKHLQKLLDSAYAQIRQMHKSSNAQSKPPAESGSA